jgi:putative FmdB family regulatory protein
MPLFDFKCSACEKVIEVIQKAEDPPPTECPHCKKENTMVKQLGVATIQLNGSGWFRDGYK